MVDANAPPLQLPFATGIADRRGKAGAVAAVDAASADEDAADDEDEADDADEATADEASWSVYWASARI
jgi:hypothetical protein